MALINCPECGKQVSDRAEACPSCGHPIASLLPVRDHFPAVTPSTPHVSPVRGGVACPLCGNGEHTVKVSAIYASQTSIERYGVSTHSSTPLSEVVRGQPYRTHTSHGSGTTTAQTQLAQMLAPPARPSAWLTGMRMGGCLGLIIGVGLAVFLLVAAGETLNHLYSTNYFAFILLFGLALLGPMLIGYIRDKPGYEKEMTIYRQQGARWYDSYYCPRHDCVFVASGSPTVPPSRFRELLMSPPP